MYGQMCMYVYVLCVCVGVCVGGCVCARARVRLCLIVCSLFFYDLFMCMFPLINFDTLHL